MDVICDAATKTVTVFVSMCIMKLMLPGGNMKRGASRAVDIVTLLSLINIIAGVLPNGW